MKEILKESCPSYSALKIWMSKFQTGHFKVTNDPWSGQPTSTTTENKTKTVYIILLRDFWISAKIISSDSGDFLQKVGQIIHKYSGHKKVLHKIFAKIPESRSEVHQSDDIKDNFCSVCSRSWFYGSFSDHGWNLASSWTSGQAAINGVAPQWLTASQEVSDPEVSWQDTDFSVLGQRWTTPHKIPAKGVHHQCRIEHVGWTAWKFEAETLRKNKPWCPVCWTMHQHTKYM